MREIKFRAYNKKYGIHDGIQEVTSLFPRRKAVMCTNWRCKFEDIELMQYTGLKDKNGVEIYEGDILDYDGEYWLVEYSDEDGMFILYYDNVIENFSNMNSKCFEVIGNVWENGDLLNDSK